MDENRTPVSTRRAMQGCGVKAGQNLPFSNPTPICRMLLCACMMGSAGGAATFDSYHVAGRLGAGGANLQIANQFNSADSTEDHLWSIGGGGAGGLVGVSVTVTV